MRTETRPAWRRAARTIPLAIIGLFSVSLAAAEEPSLDAYAKQLGSPDRSARAAAALALDARVGSHASGTAAATLTRILTASVELPELLVQSRQSDPALREGAIRFMGVLVRLNEPTPWWEDSVFRPEAVLEPLGLGMLAPQIQAQVELSAGALVKALGDPSPRVRAAAADAIAELPDAAAAKALEPLLAALADADPAVRQAAATAAVRLGPTVIRRLDEHHAVAARPLLASLFWRPSPDVQRAVHEALGRIGAAAKAAEPQLCDTLARLGPLTSPQATASLAAARQRVGCP